MSNVIRLTQPEQINLFAQNEMNSVEQLMVQLARGECTEHAGKMVTEHLQTGGKRLRARLALAATSALGGSVEVAINWAAAVELLHNATLIHDDIQDGDRVRRGHPTTWVNHGEAQAINAGDLMLMLPFLSLSQMNTTDRVRWLLSWRLAKQAAQTVRGQVEELEIIKDHQLTRERYFRSVRGKTGGFFALPIEGAALLFGYSESKAATLGECFLELGPLFQMQDDILDLYGEKGRGLRGSDIYEGKPSILVLHHLEINPQDHEFIWGILSKSRGDTTQEEVEHLITVFRTSGALAASLQDIEELRGKLINQPELDHFPEMLRLLRSVIQLILSPISGLLCP